jgi:peptide/nickel transport system permease protein
MNTSSTPTLGRETPRWAAVAPIFKSWLGLFSIGWLALLALVCIFGPMLPILPDPNLQDLPGRLQLPSAEHWLGTDPLGRDVLSRIVYGGRIALTGAVLATVIAFFLGGLIGLIAGWIGGWVDGLANRVAELLFSIPAIVILLAFAVVFGRDVVVSMTVFGILMSSSFIRLAQGATRSVRRELYIDAAKVSGVPSVKIVFGELLPNIVGPLIVQSSLVFGASLLVMSSLGFLGLGPPPPAAEWGGMIAEAAAEIYRSPWLLVPTGVVLALTILAANLLGDVIRDGDESARKVSVLRRPRHAVSRSSVTPDASATSGNSLTVRDLRIAFPSAKGDSVVVDGVDFELGEREILGLVGESGSGKTMSALAVLGLTPSPGRITSGSILFDGTDIVTAPEKRIRQLRGRGIAMISQEPMVALDPSFTIHSQLVGAIRRLHGIGRAAARTRALDLLRDVGLLDGERVLRSFPFQLSGGMAQRVCIALALAGEPRVLIADEPTTALDVTVQAGILDLLREIRDRRGMSILLVTHDLGVVADICDRVAVMEKGKIVERAEVDELFSQPQHPYTKALISNTPSLIEVNDA